MFSQYHQGVGSLQVLEGYVFICGTRVLFSTLCFISAAQTITALLCDAGLYLSSSLLDAFSESACILVRKPCLALDAAEG